MRTFLDFIYISFVLIGIPLLGSGLIEMILQEELNMNNYNIIAGTETQKYNIINIIRQAGAVLTGVSGCGTGYYIQIDATPEQADNINLMLGGATT